MFFLDVQFLSAGDINELLQALRIMVRQPNSVFVQWFLDIYIQ